MATTPALADAATSADTAVPTNTPLPTDISTLAPTVTPEPTDTPIPTTTPEPTNSPTPTATPDPNLIRTGTHLVGEDIQAGIYLGQAGLDFFSSCYWERVSDLSGEFGSLIANDNSIGQFYVEVQDSDFAFKTDCDMVLLETLPAATEKFPVNLLPGMYLVNRDIQPGLYKGVAGIDFLDSCYWERLENVSGSFDGLVANDNEVGQFYIEVGDGDFAFSTACELTLLDQLPESVIEFPATIQPGTYLVGIDIAPGLYKGEAGTGILDACYWERVSGLSGEFGELIANDNGEGVFYVQVNESDFALETACELTLEQ